MYRGRSRTSWYLVPVCICVLVQWPDDDLYSRLKLVPDNIHLQKSELCVIENFVRQLSDFNET
jgi:hypothetical protein